jgi:hypothetical protein
VPAYRPGLAGLRDSLRRIAETQNHLFHTRIELPLLRSSLSQREMIKTAIEVARSWRAG